MRFEFVELPVERGGELAQLVRPVVPVQVENLEEAPQLCLIDTGSTANRFGAWLAEALGIDLAEAPETELAIAGGVISARHVRCDLTIAGVRYAAPVSFCDPWPFAFHLLGQEGFLRFFRLTLSAAECWLEIDPELGVG